MKYVWIWLSCYYFITVLFFGLIAFAIYELKNAIPLIGLICTPILWKDFRWYKGPINISEVKSLVNESGDDSTLNIS